MKTIALLSGGLDSCVAAALTRADGDELLAAVTVSYGQRHSRELLSAEKVAAHFGLRWYVIDLSNSGFSHAIRHATALLKESEESLPHDRAMSEMTAKVPRTYVPGRNTIMLSLAQSLAEALDYDQICCGFNAVDFSGYPDCRPLFVEAWNHLARYATRRGYEGRPITLVAPIVNSSKASVVQRGVGVDAPLHLTWSCYEGGDQPCGKCDSCIIRWNAFRACGLEDPVGPYAVVPKESF